MSSITLMVGIPGSGKTTRARELQQKAKQFTIIVSRDKIREQIFGYTEDNIVDYYKRADMGFCEGMVTLIQNDTIRNAIQSGWSVIVDNTNLKTRDIKQFSCFGVPVAFEVLDVPVFECVQRDRKRTRKVGEAVIQKKYADFCELKKEFDFKPINSDIKPLENNKSLPQAYIFDIDGTLAERKDRGPFDWDRVYNDVVVENVREILWSHQENNKRIIICTGRDGISEDETKRWLADNAIFYDCFYTRKIGDYRKDYVVKEEFWRDIVKNYYIVGLYDDRNQVVDHARNLGLTVCQVNYGNF